MIQLPLRLAIASLLLWPLAACGSTATGVTVTDENPFPGGAFYRFEARLAP